MRFDVTAAWCHIFLVVRICESAPNPIVLGTHAGPRGTSNPVLQNYGLSFKICYHGYRTPLRGRAGGGVELMPRGVRVQITLDGERTMAE